MKELIIIDAHTHTFPDKIAERAVDQLSHTSHTIPFSDGREKGLIASMKRDGIDRSIILPVATNPHQVEKINDASVLLNCHYRGQLMSLGCMHPDFKDYKGELARIKEMGLKGIKIHPVYQDADLDGDRFLPILKEAARLNLIVVTHGGLDIGFPGVVRCSPQMARHVIDEIGSFPFVVAHMGGWRNWDEAASLLKGTGVYIDTAFSHEQFYPLDDGYWKEDETKMLSDQEMVTLIHQFGADHVLFGSDSPWSSQKKSREGIERLDLTFDEKRLILGENAKELFEW
ncbi:MAG: amidohydrolase family protein [Erysipelotrichaceae bacterium]|nr:amidohydrolase family protein [Erysipelotrichaceae bacterium]